MKDYYKILEIDKKASQSDIKKAFHKLAHKYHPDKKGGDEKKFKEVNEAYRVLSDDKKRAQYDQFGTTGNMGGGFGAGQGFGGFDFSQFNQQGNNFNFEDFDLGDIFGQGFGFNSRARTRRGQDMVLHMEISFEESIFGVEKFISINRTATCERCSGSGAKEGSEMITCPECHGSGQVQAQMMGIFSITQTCPTCAGRKTVPKEKCASCKGAGIKLTQENIKARIPSGVSSGNTLKIPGKGEAVRGGISGDLYIKITVKPHKTFKRDGNNLRTEHRVSLKDVLLGAVHEIILLDKSKIKLTISEGTQYGEEIRIKGKGIPETGGDLIVKITFDIPNKISKKQREALEELF